MNKLDLNLFFNKVKKNSNKKNEQINFVSQKRKKIDFEREKNEKTIKYKNGEKIEQKNRKFN